MSAVFEPSETEEAQKQRDFFFSPLLTSVFDSSDEDEEEEDKASTKCETSFLSMAVSGASEEAEPCDVAKRRRVKTEQRSFTVEVSTEEQRFLTGTAAAIDFTCANEQRRVPAKNDIVYQLTVRLCWEQKPRMS